MSKRPSDTTSLEAFVRKNERNELAASLNALLASPTFACWREGASLDVGQWLERRDGRTPAVVVSVAYLDDEERALALGVVLEEIRCWVRGLGGSRELEALVVFDDVYGFLPPHPSSPPTKRPLVSLMKQARAFGVGVIFVATQNPMDLECRALSNAGAWCLGRLQTDADRARFVRWKSRDKASRKSSPAPSTEASTSFKLRLNVVLRDEVTVARGRSLQASVRGKTTLEVGDGPARIGGTFEIPRGTVDLCGRRFKIVEATLSVNEDEPTTPVVSATAEYAAPGDSVITARFTGTVQSGSLTLSSQPALTQPQILNVIAFGSPDGPAAAHASESSASTGAPPSLFRCRRSAGPPDGVGQGPLDTEGHDVLANRSPVWPPPREAGPYGQWCFEDISHARHLARSELGGASVTRSRAGKGDQ